MILRLYVHDLHPEIGHSRATIDLLNHLTEAQKSVIEKIEVIAYTSTPLEKLFPWKSTTLEFIQVPFPHLYPFIFKSLFYQLWTVVHHWLHRREGTVSLSVGIAFPLADVVNIQFVHHHWSLLSRIYERAPWYKRLYKKILFSYFEACENVMYRNPKRSFLVLSQFTKDFLEETFELRPGQAHLTYSSVNTENFKVLPVSKSELVRELQSEAPELSSADLSRPIFLFVGGYERKGLREAIRILEAKGGQFIIIGRPEDQSQKLEIPGNLRVIRVPFTKKLNLYYNLADCFIFPTTYEPFGLVVLEAAMTGLSVIVPEKNVGASELLRDDPNVFFSDRVDFSLPEIGVKTHEERTQLVSERKRRLQGYTWERTSEIFFSQVLAPRGRT